MDKTRANCPRAVHIDLKTRLRNDHARQNTALSGSVKIVTGAQIKHTVDLLRDMYADGSKRPITTPPHVCTRFWPDATVKEPFDPRDSFRFAQAGIERVRQPARHEYAGVRAGPA
jgi:hypothetical protein